MKISTVFSQAKHKKRTAISFEIFPPKKKKVPSQKDFQSLLETVNNLADLKPDFVSITYGAGGTDSEGSLELAEHVKELGMVALPHFTAIGYPLEAINSYLETLVNRGFENVLALRGDLPENPTKADQVWRDFLHASDLIKVIARDFPGLCIGGAAYPEGHNESVYAGQDIEVLKLKENLGVEFFLTQLFFNNDNFMRFLDNARRQGVTAPISAGVMPVLSPKFIDKIVELSGVKLPRELAAAAEQYGDDENEFKKRSKDFCIRQINDLLERGVDGIHLYTMNRYHDIQEIVDALE